MAGEVERARATPAGVFALRMYREHRAAKSMSAILDRDESKGE
jgi:hypothetical protein